jgi:hypothetical protein
MSKGEGKVGKMIAVCERWLYYREALLSKEFEANSPTLKQLLDDTAAVVKEQVAHYPDHVPAPRPGE